MTISNYSWIRPAFKENSLRISEYFYSLQGEGRTAGIPAFFLRLTGCNLLCGGRGTHRDGALHDGATWRCDTIEVWLRGEEKSFAAWVEQWEAELQFLQRLRQGAHLVITGGEPLMWQPNLIAFLAYLREEHALKPVIEIETNATFVPLPELEAAVSFWNVSPKLSNSGMPAERRLVPEALTAFWRSPKTIFKFVVASPHDWLEIERDFLATGRIHREQIVLMPAAMDLAQLLENNRMVAEICIREAVRMGTRLHIEIWNQRTGV